MKKSLLVFILAAMSSRADLEVYACDKVISKVAKDNIASDVKGDEEIVSVVFHEKKGKLRDLLIARDVMPEAFAAAESDKDENEAFFGTGESFIVCEKQSGVVYLFVVEETRKRFQIAPLCQLGDTRIYSKIRYSYISADVKLIDLIVPKN